MKSSAGAHRRLAPGIARVCNGPGAGVTTRPAPVSVLGVLAVLALAGAVGCSDPERGTVLRLAHSLEPSHPVHAAMEHLAVQVEERSRGALRIKIYASSQLGSERETIELLQLGAIDLVKTSTSPLEGFVPGMAVFGVPYVFRDAAHYWRVLDGPLGRQLLDLGLGQRLKGLCYYDAGSRSFYTKNKPIRTPADLRGMKIRVQNSRTAIRLIEAMGGAATPIPFGELYTALDQGVVDGAENNPPSLLTSRHYEVCKFYTGDEHSRVPDMVLIGTATWERLTPQQRQWLQEAADSSSRFQRELWGHKTQETLAQLAQAGVQIIEADQRPFQAAVRDLQAAFRGTETGRWMQAILEHP